MSVKSAQPHYAYGDPGGENPLIYFPALLLRFATEFNVLDFALLLGISRIPFYRRNPALGRPFWQATAYVIAVAVARSFI